MAIGGLCFLAMSRIWTLAPWVVFWCADYIYIYIFKRLESQHYRAVRAAVRDFKRSIPRAMLDIISKRAPPRQWSNYTTASTAMWLYNTSDTRLAIDLRASAYVNDRRLAVAKFCDASRGKIGRQALRNRLNHINVITFDWIKDNIFKDYLRVNLKKQFFFYWQLLLTRNLFKFLRQIYLFEFNCLKFNCLILTIRNFCY